MSRERRFQAIFGIEGRLALIAVLLASFLRLYRLDAIPPALYWDEAFDALDAARLIQTSVFPIFFDGNFGREPLTIYLQALGMLLFGTNEWVARLVPGIIGIATIPVIYLLGNLLFAQNEHARKISALAAGMLAVSFWHIQLSRTSLRVVSFPLFSAIAVYFFYRGWQNRGKSNFVLGGIALGLTLYTYLAARLLPFVVIGFVSIALLLAFLHLSHVPPLKLRDIVLGLSIMIISMLLVLMPLGIYFMQHPGAFFLRASLVSIIPNDTTGVFHLIRNIIATIRMFIDRGDPTPYYNLPMRAALDWVTALGFWLGLIIAFARSRLSPGYLFLMVWLGVGLVPTIFSDLAPHFLRASGALLPTLLLAAYGLVWIWEKLFFRAKFSLAAVTVVLFCGMLTFNDYFNVWGSSRTVFDEFEVAKRTMLQQAISLSNATDVILPFRVYCSPQAEFYWGPRFVLPELFDGESKGHPAVWITYPGWIERTIVVMQKDGRVFLPQPLNDQQFARLSELMKNGELLEDSVGYPTMNLLHIEDPKEFLAKPLPSYPIDVNFGGRMRMWGYDIEPRLIVPGARVRITYYWQALVDEMFDYRIQTALLDANMNVLGKHHDAPHSGKAPTNYWKKGEIVLDSFEMPVPLSVHPGQYRFEVKVIGASAPDMPLAVLSSEDHILLAPVTVGLRPVDLSATTYPLSVGIGNPPVMTLLGYDVEPAYAARGETTRITFFWRSEETVTRDYSVFLHLRDANGEILTQQDGPPQNGNAPTSWWVPGDIIVDTHELVILSEIFPGRYDLSIGVYDSANGSRLPISAVDGVIHSDNSLHLSLNVIDR